jgi:mono/diheme cytochrome c family protein
MNLKILMVAVIAAALLLLPAGAEADWKNMNTKDDLSVAEENYQLYCVNCHGSEGKGDGILAETLDVPPRNHTDASIMGKRTDASIFKTIAKGGASNGFSNNMPPHETILSRKEIEGLVKYVRKLCNCKGK